MWFRGASTSSSEEVCAEAAAEELRQEEAAALDGAAAKLQAAERGRTAKIEMNKRRKVRDDGAATRAGRRRADGGPTAGQVAEVVGPLLGALCVSWLGPRRGACAAGGRGSSGTSGRHEDDPFPAPCSDATTLSPAPLMEPGASRPLEHGRP